MYKYGFKMHGKTEEEHQAYRLKPMPQPLAFGAEHIECIDPTRIIAWPAPASLEMRDLAPEFKVFSAGRCIECGHEAGDNWAKEMVPCDHLDTIILELLEPPEDIDPVRLFALQGNAGDSAS
jgi:hypothetical protein